MIIVLAACLLSGSMVLASQHDLHEDAPLINQEAEAHDRLTLEVIKKLAMLSKHLQMAELHTRPNCLNVSNSFFEDKMIDLTILKKLQLEDHDSIARSWKKLEHPEQMSLATSLEIPQLIIHECLIKTFENSDCPCSIHRGGFLKPFTDIYQTLFAKKK